ncbi:chromate transporter [Diplocloster hominis]|uniref:chromate transporter n=1 Tax=Diplocloster hominis TaxID=3079010 RepID=UPI0031BB4AAD
MIDKPKKYWKLFTSTFFLSSFTFGGGYVIIPLMKRKFVDDLQWLEEEDMLNMAAIAQSSPGAVAVNASILLGYRVAGVIGAGISILGTVLPPLLLLSVLSLFYTAFRSNPIVSAVLGGMQAGVAAVIADVVISMGGNIIKEKKLLYLLIMAGAFLATYLFHINVMYIILVCGALGALQTLITHWKNKKKERVQP